MSGVITAVAASAAIGAGTAAYSGHQARKADKSARARLDGLKWEEDPLYTKSQDELSTLGSGLLKGEVPDYYKTIGESGSSEFEKMLAQTTRDIQKSATESAAASGGLRGGNLAALTAGTLADADTSLRYADYQRALGGKQYLLGLGADVTSDVRNAAAGNQTQLNALEQSKAGAYNQLDFSRAQAKSNEVAGYGSALTSLIGGVSGQGGGSTGLLSQLFAQYGQQNTAGQNGVNTQNQNLTGVSSLGGIQKSNARTNYLSASDVGGY